MHRCNDSGRAMLYRELDWTKKIDKNIIPNTYNVKN